MDLGLVQRRVALQPGGQVGDVQAPAGRLGGEGVGQGPVGPLVVVAERLAVEGDGHEAAPPAGGGRGPVDQRLAGDRLEGQGVGQPAVVHDEVDPKILLPGMDEAVGDPGVDGMVAVDRRPLPVGHGGQRAAGPPGQGPDGRHLAGGQDREPHALLGQDGQHRPVDRRLRQPHARGGAPEAVAEVGQAPADLGADVALVGQRQDHVVEGLGDGSAPGLGGPDPVVDVGLAALQPRHQRRPDVEGQFLVVVDDGQHPAVGAEDPGEGVGPVALGRDAAVPVVEGRRRRLPGHLLRPGVLPGRLVEVRMDDERGGTHPPWIPRPTGWLLHSGGGYRSGGAESSGSSQTTPSGGRVSASDWSWPCQP